MIRSYIFIAFAAMAIAACSTPSPVTGRTDKNVSTSGTIGSVKATDGPPPERLPVPKVPDTTKRRPGDR